MSWQPHVTRSWDPYRVDTRAPMSASHDRGLVRGWIRVLLALVVGLAVAVPEAAASLRHRPQMMALALKAPEPGCVKVHRVQRSRRFAVYAFAGAALLGAGALGVGLSSPRKAGNSGFSNARARAAWTMAIPAILLGAAGGLALIGVRSATRCERSLGRVMGLGIRRHVQRP